MLTTEDFSARCFTLRRRCTEFDEVVIDCGALALAHQQDLANCLPFLACGEESAAHTFAGTLSRRVKEASRAQLRRVAQDELRHEAWLARLALALPAPESSLSTSESAAFFKHLVTRNVGLHFARIAALDLAVCRLLARLTHRDAALQAAPNIRQGLAHIARDEARHVRVASQLAGQHGVSLAMQEEIDQDLAAQLALLLAPIQPGLQRLMQRDAAACH
ncbi:ferritin family protein [Rhodoferax sp.]|uniref:ferritin family protein n=1 Tax=Rhodoferax sp. TaxID=50421 RepID=UPI0025DC85CA|nr:ferritin family protein [Rhodoferax sp.]